MNDAEFEAQRARVQALVDRWLPRLGLKWWVRIEVVFVRDQAQMGNEHADAHCHASWEYRAATLTFSLPKCADLDDEMLESIVVHELCHVLTAGFDSLIPDDKQESPIIEHTVTSLAQAFLWVRDFAANGEMSLQGEQGRAA